MHRIFEQLLKTLDPVIVTHIVCPNGLPIDTNGSTTANAPDCYIWPTYMTLRFRCAVDPLSVAFICCTIYLCSSAAIAGIRLDSEHQLELSLLDLGSDPMNCLSSSQIQYNFMVMSRVSYISIVNISPSRHSLCLVP